MPSDSDSALSAGPGNDAYVDQPSIKLEFDLSKLDPATVSIIPLAHGSNLRIRIAPTDKTRAASVGSFTNKSFDLPFASVVVKKKAANRIADEFRIAIQLCSH